MPRTSVYLPVILAVAAALAFAWLFPDLIGRLMTWAARHAGEGAAAPR